MTDVTDVTATTDETAMSDVAVTTTTTSSTTGAGRGGSPLSAHVAEVVARRSAEAGGARRLNWGSGEHAVAGWVGSDIKDAPGVDIAGDIREGLPFPDATFDCVVSNHALPMIHYREVVGVLSELRRVVVPGGTLRLVLPDLEKAMAAYRRGDRDYFLVPDADEQTLGGKLVTQILWYGYSVLTFTPDFAEDLLRRAGFAEVHHCLVGQTRSWDPGIVELDSRPLESLFIEGVK